MRRERFLIWGGGGHGKVVADAIRESGHTVAGFADADLAKLGAPAGGCGAGNDCADGRASCACAAVEPGGATVVITEAELVRCLAAGELLPDGVTALALGIGANAARHGCLSHARDVVPLPPVVHPSATVSRSAGLGVGTVVFPGAVVNAGAAIGAAVVINSGAIVEHDCVIGDGAHVAPGAVLTGAVRVGCESLIGARAVVLPGIVVGHRVIVGAGAVVTRDVPDGATVAGVPAKLIDVRSS